jgi:hypothetical protein
VLVPGDSIEAVFREVYCVSRRTDVYLDSLLLPRLIELCDTRDIVFRGLEFEDVGLL